MKKIMKSAALIVTTITLVFAIQSCNSTKPLDKAKLEGFWSLKSLQGEDAKEAFKGPNPSLQFDFTNGNVSGSAGCNDFSGAFTLSETNEFSAPNLAATMKMCFQENKEPQYLKALSTPNLSVSLNENGELVFKQGEEVMLQFVKGETPAKEATFVSVETLEGKWNLTSIADGDISTLFAEKKPTIEFAEENKVFGHAGCNTYRTTYELSENIVTFKPVASTMMACPSMEGENKFTGLLTTPLQVAVDGDKLTFSKEGNIVLEFVKDTENK